MLENIVSEMDYNLQKIDQLLPLLETWYQDSKITAPSPSLFLSAGAFRAAVTTGQLRYIPKYAFALIAYYEGIESTNVDLEMICRYTGFRTSYKSLEIENLRRRVGIIIKELKSFKETMPKMKNLIHRDKSLIVHGKIRPKVERLKDGLLIIHQKASTW